VKDFYSVKLTSGRLVAGIGERCEHMQNVHCVQVIGFY